MKEFDFESTPIVDIVNEIIINAVKLNASDIHFDPAEKYLKIRLRIDGDLVDYSLVDNKYKRNLITRVKLLSGMNITESRLPQDGAIKSTIEGVDLDLRVSDLPTSFGEKVVVRILDYSMSLQGLEHLGFSKENYDLIMKMLANPNGIILITGATGSGKSTTVYSMLQKLNKQETNIITVEDPVEMNIEGLNQVQVNSEIGLTFANVLRSILRQDPNVILIGEIRDSETAKIAIRSSITGHLVLSTLHTNNSLTTIERLIDMDVERYLLSSSLKGIISQTLAKKLCLECATKRPTTEAEKRIFKKALGLEVNEIYEPGHCSHCHNGYRGRIALQEVLYLNDSIRDAINKNVDRTELRRLIYKRGVKTLLQDGLLKAIQGITSISEVFRLVDVDDDIDNIYGNDDETEAVNVRTLDNSNTSQIVTPVSQNTANVNNQSVPLQSVVTPTTQVQQPTPVVNPTIQVQQPTPVVNQNTNMDIENVGDISVNNSGVVPNEALVNQLASDISEKKEDTVRANNPFAKLRVEENTNTTSPTPVTNNSTTTSGLSYTDELIRRINEGM